MEVLAYFLIIFKIFLVSSASESPDIPNNNEENRQLPIVADSPDVDTSNSSSTILERVEKKKHLFVLLEEEEDDQITELRSGPDSPAIGQDQRFGYSRNAEKQDGGNPSMEEKMAADLSFEDQQTANGTNAAGPKKPVIVHSSSSYIIPIIICLGLVLAALMFFTYYFKWTERVFYNSTDYRFSFFNVRVTEVPPVPDY